MKLIPSIMGAAAATVALTASAWAQEATLRLHQFLPPQAAIPAALEEWGDRVEERSDGRIVVEHYPAMQLGGAPPQLFDQARDGVVDIIWTVLGYTPGRFPKSEAFELPFMIGKSAEATSQAFHEYVTDNAMSEYSEVHLLAAHVHGPGLFHMKEPVNQLDDLEGKQVRGGSRIINEMLVSLGAEPIGMPVPAVTEALSTGVIDGTTIPWEVTTSLRTSELVENHTGFSGDRGLYSQTFAVVMNKDTYEGLSEDLQRIIDEESGIDLAAELGRAMDEFDERGEQIARDLGNNIITLDDEETARWKEAAQPIVDNWIESTENGQELYDAARAAVAEHIDGAATDSGAMDDDAMEAGDDAMESDAEAMESE